MLFGMFLVSLQCRDPASERSGSNILGCDLAWVLAGSLSASSVEILFPNAQAPASWGCDLAYFFACFLLDSTVETVFPNAQAPAYRGMTWKVFCDFVSASTIEILFPNAQAPTSGGVIWYGHQHLGE